MLSLFDLLAGLLTLTATFAWVNHRFIGLPANIGLLIMGLCASLLLIAVEFAFPNTPIYGSLARALAQIDFYDAVMNGMLAFLLFAGAVHVDLSQLRSRAAGIGVLATLGVAISTGLIASGFWGLAQILGMPVSFAWALVFGALVAPTDPVAVISTLKAVKVPKALETDMTGEALFNDGIAVVVFAIFLEAAVGEGQFGAVEVGRLLLIEAGGGAILGLAAGLLAYRGMHSIDDYAVEVMISLALVTGTYALAQSLHMSGPLAVVVAGVLIGNHGAKHAMSDMTQRYLFGFWTLTDDILNALLFLLIGLEVLILNFAPGNAWIALAAVPLAIAARFAAVSVPVVLIGRWQRFARGTIPVLTWGGVRGGISIALALSLPESAARPVILAATYAIVLFTIVVQGLSLGWVVRRTAQDAGARDAERAHGQ